MMVALLFVFAFFSSPSDSIHVVQRGETMYSISRTYQITVPQLQQWNGLTDTRLAVGAELRVIAPVSTGVSDASTASSEITTSSFGVETLKAEPEDRSVSYTVRSGDTLYGLSQRFNVTVSALRSLNQLTSDQLSIGQVLVLRREQITPSIATEIPENRPQGIFHTYSLGRNETLNQVLARFSMDETEFRALNPGVDPASVSSGQNIVVLLPPDRRFQNPYAQKGISGQKERVTATIYTPFERATPTANGELVNLSAFTAGHSSYPLGSLLLVENPSNGYSVLVRINDRIRGAGLKITPATAQVLKLDTQIAESTTQVLISVTGD